MRTTFTALAVLTLATPTVASAQQTLNILSERPAVGLALGAGSWGGDDVTQRSAVDVGMYADAPVMPGVRIRGDVSRATWVLERTSYDVTTLDRLTVKNLSVSAVWLSHLAQRRFVPYAGVGYGVYHFSASREAIRHPWRGGFQALAAFEFITPGDRYAIDTEIRLHGIDGLEQPPVNATFIPTLDARIGVKLRF